MDKGISNPRVAAFEVTRRCPLHCRHCRASAEAEGTDPLSTEACRRILKGLSEYTRCVVILTGGEPMVREDCFELIEYGRGLGHRMSLATCGWYIDKESARKLKEAGVLAVSFSLDGADARTHDSFRQSEGAYSKTLAAIETVKEAGLRFQINTTITRLNAGQAEGIARTSAALGAICWNPFILVPVGRGEAMGDLLLGPEEYERLLEHLAKLKEELKIDLRLTCGPQFARVSRQQKISGADKTPGCLAATDFVFISHNGDVQTCGFLEISAGNLVKNGFDFGTLWTGSDYLNSLRDFSQYKGSCGSCGYLAVCRGCRARAQAVYGDFLQQDPICRLARPGDEETA